MTQLQASSLSLVVFALFLCCTFAKDCELRCHGTEFCGNDDKCHQYNCFEWFRFGPKAYTGIDLTSDTPMPTLTCQPWVRDETAERRKAVRYGCNPYIRSSTPPQNTEAMDFDEICTSIVDEGNVFECLQLSSITFFSDFLTAVKESNIGCSRFDEEDFQPVYYYSAAYANQLQGSEVEGYAVIKDRTFDLSLALNFTFDSVLKPANPIAPAAVTEIRERKGDTGEATSGTRKAPPAWHVTYLSPLLLLLATI